MSFVRRLFPRSVSSARLTIVASIGLAVAGCSGGDTSSTSGGGATSSPSTASDAASDSASPGAVATGAVAADEPAVADSSTGEVEATGGTGTLTGTVVLDGNFTELPLLHAAGAEVKDAEVCSRHDVIDDSLLINQDAGNGITNVFVYLAKAPSGAQSAPVPDVPVEFDQKDCMFVQHALIARIGQAILIKSGDAVPHNVHTFPKFQPQYNQICQPNEREGLKLVYEKPEREPVEVKCDIHPWMKAYHLPVDHSFATVSDTEGKFTIEGLPAGKHKFFVWHEKSQFINKSLEVVIKADEASEISIKVTADQLAAQDNRPRRIVATVE